MQNAGNHDRHDNQCCDGNTDALVGTSSQWNRGRLLVEGAAHCAACHTGRTLAGELDEIAQFAGNDSLPGGRKAPSILTADLIRRGATVASLAYALQSGLLPNFGEGLAIGGAFAAGSEGLGTFLVLGFALHNVTEGIGIAAPILRIRPPLWTFAALTLLAGGPAIFGMWVGSLAYAPQWSAFALAIGAVAILQVIVEVTAYLLRQNSDRWGVLFSPGVLGGFLGGLAFMYATAAVIRV